MNAIRRHLSFLPVVAIFAFWTVMQQSMALHDDVPPVGGGALVVWLALCLLFLEVVIVRIRAGEVYESVAVGMLVAYFGMVLWMWFRDAETTLIGAFTYPLQFLLVAQFAIFPFVLVAVGVGWVVACILGPP